MDRGTTLELRFDRQRSLHQLQSLPHADEAKTSALPCRFAVKAHAGIPYCEMNLIRRSPQAHFEVPYSAVFHRIVEGFLQNSEEAQRRVRLQRAGQIMAGKVNVHFLLLSEFFAEASHGASNTQILQFCRVQLV